MQTVADREERPLCEHANRDRYGRKTSVCLPASVRPVCVSMPTLAGMEGRPLSVCVSMPTVIDMERKTSVCLCEHANSDRYKGRPLSVCVSMPTVISIKEDLCLSV